MSFGELMGTFKSYDSCKVLCLNSIASEKSSEGNLPFFGDEHSQLIPKINYEVPKIHYSKSKHKVSMSPNL